MSETKPQASSTTDTATRSLSLRTKWTATLLLVGAAPLAAFAYRTTVIQKSGLEDAERQIQASVIDHVGSLVDRSLDEAADGTQEIGRILTEPKIVEPEVKIALAKDAMTRVAVLAQVAIYTPDGEMVDAIGPEPKPPQKLSPAQLGMQKGTWLPIEYAGSVALIRYLEPVVRDGQRQAFMLGTLKPHLLSEQVLALSKDRFEGRPDGVLLLDGDAHVLASGDKTTFTVGTALAGRDLFPPGQPPSGAFSHPYASATEYVDAAGVPMVGSVRSLPTRSFAVVVRRPSADVFKALAKARRELVVAASGFVLAALALGAYLATRTTRPIRSLVDLARAYGRRELDKRSTVTTGDELELLGTSMTRMADDIATSEAEIARRAGVERDLSRYLPAEIAKSIAEGKHKLALGGERKLVTILFADVVAFTPFAERASPEAAVGFLNELFSLLSEIVFRHGGTLDKFIGDSVMAIFGAPNVQEDASERALATAEDMHRFVEASAGQWKDKYGFDVRLGIGISTGEALVGNLGSEARLEYTAIGDVVNVAARLEGLARPGQTLVTGDVTKATDAFDFNPLGDHPVRGKSAPVAVFEVA